MSSLRLNQADHRVWSRAGLSLSVEGLGAGPAAPDAQRVAAEVAAVAVVPRAGEHQLAAACAGAGPPVIPAAIPHILHMQATNEARATLWTDAGLGLYAGLLFLRMM